ncbi:MAG: Maf family protein [Lachnospiraceae bacterium]|nr:Maf family protein [Lachnospiraceae bacterium]
MKIILASSSPRRKELLEQAGIVFETDTSEADETVEEKMSPPEYVEELSGRKAAAVAARHPGDVIIGADTIVALEGDILGKPSDVKEAYRMLKRLAGKTHSVYTGVTILYPKPDGQHSAECFHVKTDVKMYEENERLIRKYANCGEPLDKAGAYGIQGKGAVLVERIEGDYSNVKGLPLAEVYRRLYNKGVFEK